MKRHISTAGLGGELAIRVGLLAGMVLVVGGAVTGEGQDVLLAHGGLRQFFVEAAAGYATRLHDAMSMIMTLPLF